MKRSPDIRIGYRAEEEAIRICGGPSIAARLIGCTRGLVWEWGNGAAPSAIYLQRLHEMGADVIYILTGRRSKPLSTGGANA